MKSVEDILSDVTKFMDKIYLTKSDLIVAVAGIPLTLAIGFLISRVTPWHPNLANLICFNLTYSVARYLFDIRQRKDQRRRDAISEFNRLSPDGTLYVSLPHLRP